VGQRHHDLPSGDLELEVTGLAEIQFESGYPYIMFEDTVNRANPIEGKITHSNLCSEILQVSTPSVFNDDLSYAKVGKDISCNLGSLNIAKAMDSPDFAQTIEVAIRALTAVSDQTHIWSVPSIEQGNNDSSGGNATANGGSGGKPGGSGCTVHTGGEQYDHRQATSRITLPPLMLTANTIGELATVYQRPLPAFLSHNPGLQPDQPLPAGTQVNIPDPGFPPLLAARLSADVLKLGPLSPAVSAMMRHLVPISAVDITANCTVLARLLLCAPTHDAEVLAEVLRLVRQTAVQAAPASIPLGFPS